MSVFIFVGPTICAQEVLGVGDFECLPPAAQGDIYRAALRRPKAIGIIDGYFHGVASIWHKEVLWSMSQGIHVFGSSSMGALRAAELSKFGMRGVGRIFEAYRDGVLEDDDEVALLHGPAELGFAALSEPMVDIKATIGRAVDDGVITDQTGSVLRSIAKAIFYQNRTWELILKNAATQQLAIEECTKFDRWLSTGRFSQKHADALELLNEVKDFVDSRPGPMEVNYSLEWTHLWDSVVGETHQRDLPGSSLIVDELRLNPERYKAVCRAALLRFLAAREDVRNGYTQSASDLRQGMTRFRLAHGLFGRKSLQGWLVKNDFDEQGFKSFISEETRLNRVESENRYILDSYILSELRLRNEYSTLAERAREKEDALTKDENAISAQQYSMMTPMLLAAWFFENRIGTTVPDNANECLNAFGLEDRAELQRLLMREYRFIAFAKGETGKEKT